MKKVLYLSNIEVPYRVRFFNELAKACDLTVLYERERPTSRNAAWAKSEQSSYKIKYLRGIRVAHESAFSLGILREILAPYDVIIVGCYNSPVQMLAMLVMRMLRIPYCINLDGEPFLGRGLKGKLKHFFLSGADKYLIAGEKCAKSLEQIAKGRQIIPYYFSSLSQQEIRVHEAAQGERNNTILVVGQYLHCKGLDVALEAARMDPSLQYKFVGMGARTDQFLSNHAGKIPANVEIIPFLQKEELEAEYRSCAMLVLPSRQECWGLVINEAASFGMPIVSTWGSGAATEFLAERYPHYLAQPGNGQALYQCIKSCLGAEDLSDYQRFLIEKGRNYTIEKSVAAHLQVCE